MTEYIDVILKLADKAYKKNEVPVGAIVVFNNKIIARAYNKKRRKRDVTNHAEIMAIKKAAHRLGDWRLNDCDLYVTLEPCNMCKEVINQARVRNVYYLVQKLDYKKDYNKTTFSFIGTDKSYQQENYKRKLSTFFKLKCKR